MAETNLGQVGAIWLNDAEPPHKNMLWLKTNNQLTNEKEGLIWNGIEWINIQGQSFYWKSEFDVNTDYTKNDVVRFSDQLYIKLNNNTSSGDTPDVSADFELFLPSLTPSGEEGSVQLKDANGRFFGSDLLSFIAGVFSVYGSFFLKSNVSTTGNALELRNSNNDTILQATNTGYVLMNRFGASTSSYFFNNAGGFEYYVSNNIKFRVYSNTAQFDVPLIVSSITCGNYSSAGNITMSGNNLFMRSNDIESAQQASLDVIGGDNTGAGNSARVRIGYKKTGTEHYALDINEKAVTFGFSDGKHGFYGAEPVAKQNLSSMATNMEIMQALENLGLIDII